MSEDRKFDESADEAPPSAEELREAESLRDALADPSKTSDAADFARAIALAHSPRAISPVEHRAIVERAIAGARPRSKEARGGRVIRVAFGVSAAMALAAGVILVVGGMETDRLDRLTRAQKAEVIPARSTQALFAEPFAKAGGESARIDRIAMARAQDYRDNQFAAWGVR